jgi:flagellar biosynthetic protein FliR
MEAYAHYLPNFLFILLRAGIVLTMLPFFSSRNFPAKFRIGVAVAISLVLTPIVDFHLAQASVPAIVIREVMFGLAFGLAGRFIFFAVDMAGQIISSATGLSAASTFNPEMGPSTDISQVLSIFATLIFLATDTHHDIIAVFVKSYELLPAGTVNVDGSPSTRQRPPCWAWTRRMSKLSCWCGRSVSDSASKGLRWRPK